MMHGKNHRVLAAAAAVMTFGVGPFAGREAAAQEHMQVNIAGFPGGGSGGGGMVSRAKLAKYERVLGLDASQAEAVRTLHEGYLKEHTAASKEFQESMNAGREDGGGPVIITGGSMGEVFTKHAERTAKIEKQFLDDVKTILTPEQIERWPALERLRRRDDLLGPCPISGANIDLISMVDRMKLGEELRNKLNEPLERYELDIDRALQDREQALSKGDDQSGKAMRMYDAESFEKRMKNERDHGVKIRDINRRYARLVAELLPQDLRAKFESDVQARSFRSAYRTTATAKELETAAKFDDLSSEQKARLQEIRDRYKQSVKAAADAMAAAQEKAEEEGKAAGIGFGLMGGKQSPELTAAKKARRELDEQTDQQLAAVLSAEQKARLPERKSNGMQMMDGLGGNMVVMMDDEDVLDDEDGDGGTVIERKVIAVDGPVIVPGGPVTPEPEKKADAPRK